jgi:flavodoxin I
MKFPFAVSCTGFIYLKAGFRVLEVVLLRVLTVYDSVSVNKNTEKVAEAIRDVLKAKGIEVESSYVEDVDAPTVKDYDCLIVGSPTHGWMETPLVKKFLDSLKTESFAGKKAAAFDTRIQSRLAGSAVDGIEKRLKKLGFKVAVSGLAIHVEGKEPSPVLVEGELDKAKKFADELIKALQ